MWSEHTWLWNSIWIWIWTYGSEFESDLNVNGSESESWSEFEYGSECESGSVSVCCSELPVANYKWKTIPSNKFEQQICLSNKPEQTNMSTQSAGAMSNQSEQPIWSANLNNEYTVKESKQMNLSNEYEQRTNPSNKSEQKYEHLIWATNLSNQCATNLCNKSEQQSWATNLNSESEPQIWATKDASGAAKGEHCLQFTRSRERRAALHVFAGCACAACQIKCA
jgi:hypothetical protein